MKVPNRPAAALAGPDLSPPGVVRGLPCGLCGVAVAVPCLAKGDHLARWLGAYSAGVITRDQLIAVVVGLVVVTKWCVVGARAEAAA